MMTCVANCISRSKYFWAVVFFVFFVAAILGIGNIAGALEHAEYTRLYAGLLLELFFVSVVLLSANRF